MKVKFTVEHEIEVPDNISDEILENILEFLLVYGECQGEEYIYGPYDETADILSEYFDIKTYNSKNKKTVKTKYEKIDKGELK